ncbi:MAG TPA: aldo/keto reductase [Tepidisphaeraceae bacterium]|nr:aldo/keto reductase [Tepidisphaeraceae bacterium]
MAATLGWGIIGTGAIAGTLANAIGKSQTGKLIAVASRARQQAETFGATFNLDATKCYGNYESLLADPAVHAVYIATPHPLHATWAIKAAEARKHVLVEKPIAVNQFQAQAIVEAAIANDVLLMEAFMYRSHPQTRRVVELLKERAIGDARVIHATFSFQAGFSADSRLYSNALAGGAILDIGCYPMSMARLLAGAATGIDFADPIDVKSVGHLESTGVDGYTLAVAKFPGDILAQLSAGVAINQENVVRIFGTDGRIFLSNPWVANRTAPDQGRIIVHRNGEKEPREITIDADVTSFTLEVDAFGDAVNSGRRQASAPAMTWADSLGNIRALDAWRSQIGLTYESETPQGYPKVTVHDRPLRVRDKNKMKYGSVPHVSKRVSRLVMGVDNQSALPQAMVMFDTFFEAGGNAFDTAFVYGGGRHEQNLGHWMKIRGVRDDVAVIVKGAHTPECYPHAITRQLLISLDRLQTDRADLYLMHRDNPNVPVGEFVDVLNEHVRAGRFNAFGGSNWSVARLTEANDYAKRKGLQGFTLMSNNFSLARMVSPVWGGCVAASDPDTRAWLTQTQTTLLAWSSQARGFFTDRAHREQALNDEELNRCWYSEDNWQRRDRVIELAKRRGVLPINIALAYVLNQPFPTFPLIGPRTLEELRTSLPALNVELSAAEVRWLNLEAASA